MYIVKNFLKLASYIVIIKFSSLIKVSFLVGSRMIWFSANNSVLPLAGAFGGAMSGGLIFLMRQLIHLAYFKTLSLSFLALCVPGLCASLYWTTSHYTIRLLLPAICIILFGIHPIGCQAFIYTIYWFIPICLYFIPQRSIFLTAFGSTFTAHAVGSVIWLYTIPMAPTTWISLMPLVFLERLFFALGMVITYFVCSFIFNVIDAFHIYDQKLIPSTFLKRK